MYINSFSDLQREVSRTPIEERFYEEDWVEIVSSNLIDLYRSKGFEYGDEEPEITSDEFWECFKDAEREEEEDV